MLGNVCGNRDSDKRYRLICKYWESNQGCTRGRECMFLHEDPKEKWNENHLKQCDACKFEKDIKEIKQHKIKEHSFMLCLNCDKNIKHK